MQVSLSLSKNDNGRSPCANVSSILFDGRGADEFRLRTRLKAAYKVTTWSPYVSLEQYHGLGKDEWFHASRFRARGGVEAKLSSSWSADVFYCYQHESDLDRHILGWELIYRF